ncbi:MAG TPA: dihydropteroate synthase [Actinomycetota bacterium]|nr:dihydropteroate synthase [Actinomycetota bacterium]
MIVHHARGSLDLSRCVVMGVVNRTPDSFFDGGRMDLAETVDHAARLVDEGAEALDLGAVKAGPGGDVGEAEELARLLPAVERLADLPVPLSVETARARVAQRALAAGAAIVNDVTGLSDRGLARVCARAGAAIVLMHHGDQIRGRPRSPAYEDVVRAVLERWHDLVALATRAGVPDDRIIVDPGLDFGKNTFHSLELMRRLPELVSGGPPVLIAASRKDVIGETLDLPPEERLEGSLALVAAAVAGGARLIRVHDVRASVRVVHMIEAVAGDRDPAAPVRGLWD